METTEQTDDPLGAVVLLAGWFPASALGQRVDTSAARGVVQINAVIPGDARTARSLGTAPNWFCMDTIIAPR